MREALIFSPCDTPLGLYAVVDSVAWIAKLAHLRVPTLQLRQKGLIGMAQTNAIHAAINAIGNHPSRLFINDYWRSALAIKNADPSARLYGVHLGQEDLDSLTPADLLSFAQSGLRLGISTHSKDELYRALSLNPSYIAIGAIFPTTTKTMPTAPQGIDNLRRYLALIAETGKNIPTVAIGGIFAHNAATVLASGVSTIAVVRAITEAKDTATAVAELLAITNNYASPFCQKNIQ